MNRSASLAACMGVLFMLIPGAFAGSDDEGDQSPKSMEITLTVNGEEISLDNLEELKKHADRLPELIDLEALIRDAKTGTGKAKIMIFTEEGGDDQTGQAKVTIKKQVFLGADGNVQVLDDDEAKPNIWITRMAADAPGKYMIGLACQPADETLRAQLNVPDGGLVVLEAIEGTPAAAADIRPHDVLVSADGKPLDELMALIKAVDQAGASDRELQLQLYRGGQKKTIAVKPQARPDKAEWKIELDEKDEDASSHEAGHVHEEEDDDHEEHEEHEHHGHEHGDSATSRIWSSSTASP